MWEVLKVLKITWKTSSVGHPAVVSTFHPLPLLPWLPVLNVKKIIPSVQKLGAKMNVCDTQGILGGDTPGERVALPLLKAGMPCAECGAGVAGGATKGSQGLCWQPRSQSHVLINSLLLNWGFAAAAWGFMGYIEL